MRRRKKIAALILSATLTCPISVSAKIPDPIYVGDVVSISAADIIVNRGYKSLSDLEDKYFEARSKAESNNTSIDSGNGKFFNNGLADILNGDDLSSKLPNNKKQTLSYDEFMELIGKQNSQIRQKYEQAKANALKQQQKGSKEGAQAIRDAIEKAMKGINPVTGKPFGSKKDSGNSIYDFLEANNLLDWLNDGLENDLVDNMPISSDFLLNYLKAKCKDEYYNVSNGNHNLVDWQRMDEEEYINDTFVYDGRENSNYNDIKYRCAKCKQIYGHNSMCACGKFLQNQVHKSADDASAFGSNDFYGFDGEGNVLSLRAGNTLLHGMIGKSYVRCGVCNKKLTKKSFDYNCADEYKFYIGSNGTWKCYECEKKGSQYKDKDYSPGNNNDTTLDDTSDWSKFNPHFETAVVPVKSKNVSKVSSGISNKNIDDIIDEFADIFSEEDIKNMDTTGAVKNYLDFRKRVLKMEKDIANMSEDLLNAIKEMSDNPNMPDLKKGINGWTQEEIKNFLDAVNKLADQGIPNDSYWDDDVERVKDTVDYDKNVNKIFANWPADRSQWTSAQKKYYDEWVKKYTSNKDIQNTLEDLIDRGVISGNKTPDEILNGIDKYIAGFTSINETVTINYMIDKGQDKTIIKKQKFTAQGDATIDVTGPNGEMLITGYVITADIPYRFCPNKAGNYTLNRKVRIYDVTYQLVTTTCTVRAELTLPDGSTVNLGSKEITRVREDKSGINTSNMRVMNASPIVLHVKDRQLDIDKKDFYDTERIA